MLHQYQVEGELQECTLVTERPSCSKHVHLQRHVCIQNEMDAKIQISQTSQNHGIST